MQYANMLMPLLIYIVILFTVLVIFRKTKMSLI